MTTFFCGYCVSVHYSHFLFSLFLVLFQAERDEIVRPANSQNNGSGGMTADNSSSAALLPATANTSQTINSVISASQSYAPSSHSAVSSHSISNISSAHPTTNISLYPPPNPLAKPILPNPNVERLSRLLPFSSTTLSTVQPGHGGRTWQHKTSMGTLGSVNEKTVPAYQVRIAYGSLSYWKSWVTRNVINSYQIYPKYLDTLTHCHSYTKI